MIFVEKIRKEMLKLLSIKCTNLYICWYKKFMYLTGNCTEIFKRRIVFIAFQIYNINIF